MTPNDFTNACALAAIRAATSRAAGILAAWRATNPERNAR